MKNRVIGLSKATVVMLTAGMLSALAGSAAGQTTTDATGITQPSKRLQLQFFAPGVIRDVKVEDGQEVKPGDVLAVQDDALELKQLQGLQIEADSLLTIEAQKTDLAQKQVTLTRKKRMRDEQHAASAEEVEQAQLDVDLAKIRVSLAEQEHQTKTVEAEKQALRVALMKLVSPIKGVIERINVREGEFADINRPEGTLIVVQNDPLWVELRDLSAAQASKLKLGEELDVVHEGEAAEKAKIIYFSPVVDAASDTRLVRLAMPNPTGRASGLHVQVKLPVLNDLSSTAK